MKLILAFVCLLFTYFANAQLATIQDKDGYTNVRALPGIQSKVIGKIYDDQVFSTWDLDYDSIPNWRKIYKWYPEKRKSLIGWMHNSRVKELDFLPELAKPDLSGDESLLTFRNDTLFFQVQFEKFDSTQHEIIRHEKGYIQTVDGQVARGTDGSMPKEGISSIRFLINGNPINVPKEAYSDLYNFRKSTFRFYINTTGTLMIRSFNSDGAAFYSLVWKFRDNQYVERFIGGT